MWPSHPCHSDGVAISATLSEPFWLITMSGYRLLYLTPWPVRKFPFEIFHEDSLNVVLYLSSAIILVEIRLLFRLGMCWTWCSMLKLQLSSLVGISPIPTIPHSCPFFSRTEPTPFKCSKNHSLSHMKGGTRIKQPHLRILCTKHDLSCRCVF